jgi:hypothetical protein
MSNQHVLKCWPCYFEAILDGRKTFEVRSTADRRFEIGDILLLREWVPETETYTGRHILCKVPYIFLLTTSGAPAAVMSLSEVSPGAYESALGGTV